MQIAPLPVGLPLLVAAILAGLRDRVHRRTAFWIALATAAAALAVCLDLLHASTTHTLVYWFGNWKPRGGVALGISFAIDPVGAGLAALACVLTIAGMIFAAKYFDTVGTLFHTLLLAFLGAMCGFSLTGDIFNLFVFFELMSASAYALAGFKTEEPAPPQGALNFAITNTVGAYFILTGIAMIYARTGALNMAQIGRTLDHSAASPVVIAGFTFIAAGFLVKGAIAPFHFWLADAHAVAPTPVCVLLSGVMVELGLYAVARVYWTMFAGTLAHGANALRVIFIAAGCATALIGAAMCWSERNLKRLLAFSTIGHMGVMTIGFALLNPEGVAGAALYALGHAGAKGGLFLVTGIILHRAESVDEVELTGRLRTLRFTGAGLLCGAAALAGIPFSGESSGAALMHHAAAAAGLGWTHWAIVLCGMVTAAAVFRFFLRSFAGMGDRPEDETNKVEERPETTEGHRHTSAVMWVPALALIAGSFALGAIPGLEAGALAAAARFVDHSGYSRIVLDGASVNSPAPLPAAPVEIRDGIIAVSAALAIAVLYLLPRRKPQMKGRLAAILCSLRDLHSGHPADYVAWLTLGAALFSAAAMVLLRA